jgi:hypothetical protein
MTTLHLRTSDGAATIPARETEAIGDALRRFGVPLSGVQPYAVCGEGLRPLSLLSPAGTVTDPIVVYATRNIPLLPHTVADWRIRSSSSMAAEYLAPTDAMIDPAGATLVQLSHADILHLGTQAMTAIAEPLEVAAHPHGKVVVGVSGGGDSNFLLAALASTPVVQKLEIIPAMVLGIEDWDTQRENAQRLCEGYGFNLTVLGPEQSARYCEVDSIAATLARYECEFPDSGREFFGTWLLRRALTGFARDQGSTVVMLGGNREDALSEALLMLSQGRRPLPMPFRRVADMAFVNPLWELPKKVIDAAFPQFSVRNYESRRASTDRGRTMYYRLAYAIEDIGLGLDLTFLRGIQGLATDDAHAWDESLQDYVVAGTEPHLIERWCRVVGRGIKDGSSQPVH